VSRRARRISAIQALANEIAAAGSTLVLTDDTLTAAHHAAKQGWIAPQELEAIVRASAADEGPARSAEPAATIVAGEARHVKPADIEAVLEAGQNDARPPNVIVEGDKN
jgi:hypothetical protein